MKYGFTLHKDSEWFIAVKLSYTGEIFPISDILSLPKRLWALRSLNRNYW